MTRWWSNIADRLSGYEAATPLALVRILVAATLLWELVDMGLSGAMALLWLPESAGGFGVTHSTTWLGEHVSPTASNIYRVYGATLVAVGCLLLGLGPRPAAFAALLGLRFLVQQHPLTFSSHDRVFSNALFVLCFARSGETLSLWAWLRRRRWTSGALVPAWPRYLLVYQLALLYTCTGIQKLGLAWWPSGGYLAVHYALLTPHFARQDWWWIAWLGPLTRMASLITWWWESLWWTVPVWMWLRSTADQGGRLRRWATRLDLRSLFVVTGLGMHLTILMMMDVGPFSLVTLALYPSLYQHDELLEAWRRLLGQGRTP